MTFEVGDIVKAKPPNKSARLGRVTAVDGEWYTVVNLTNLSGGTHRQALNSRVLNEACLSRPTKRQLRAVNEWETLGAGAALHAQARPTARRRGTR